MTDSSASCVQCQQDSTMVTSNASRQGGTKRQRIAPPPLPVTVNDLSADLWCGIADFLPKTSRALLAVALTAPPASFRESGWKGQPNALSEAVILSAKTGVLFDTVLNNLCEEARAEAKSGILRGSKRFGVPDDSIISPSFRDDLSKQMKQYYDSQWEVLDFVDIPIPLASRLTDNDVGAVLVCIDAKNNLTRLKLTHCLNVVGTGLGPLRGSTVLQYLDLEIVREFEEPWYQNKKFERRGFAEIMLFEGPVFEVLDAILEEEGNSLKRFLYPYKWYDNASETNEIKRLNEGNKTMWTKRFKQFVSDHNAVLNKFACCLYFGSVHGGDICTLLKENSPRDEANLCLSCGETSEYSNCSHCNEIICLDCCETKECSDCDVRYCPSCRADHGLAQEVTWCENVEWCEPYCSMCRLKKCKNGYNCDGCRKMTFDALFEECDKNQSQINAQRLEIEGLHRESTITEAEEPADKNSPDSNSQTANVEDETGWEPDVVHSCSRPGCNQIWLHNYETEYLPSCSGCNARYCAECDENDGMTLCRECDGQGTWYCDDCRLNKRKSDKNDCTFCKIVTFDVLLTEYNMKQAQIDSQREEIERLRQE